MGPRLAVDPVTYESASMAFGAEIAGRVGRSALGLLEALAASAGMAGTDPSGTAWAAAYDDAAGMTVGVTQDVVNGCYQLAALLQQTGFNYSRAESSSTSGAGPSFADTTAYATCSVQLCRPPSAAGHSLPAPSGWWLIEHAVGYLWPGGDQGRLRAAASVWTAAATSIGDATLYVQDALSTIASEVTPEVDDAMTACQAMDRHLWDLIAGYRALAGACEEFAESIDRAHSAVEHELADLVAWTAGIQAGGALLAVASFGISEIGAQSAQAGRVLATAGRVTDIIASLVGSVRLGAEAIAALSARVVEISRRLQPLLDARISVVTTEAVEALPTLKTAEAVADEGLAAAASLPKISVARRQVEDKFKHAAAFGVTTRKSAAGYDEFAAAITRFVEDPMTTRVIGTYHKRAAVLSYSDTTKLVVVQLPDGRFLTGWRMTGDQFRNVVERGSLGGG